MERFSNSFFGHSVSMFARGALLAVLVLLSPARAGLKEGLEAEAAKDYERVYREMRPLAEAGHPMAQGYLAWLYATGKVVPRDYGEAVKWYVRAANGGDRHAQSQLATHYLKGLGVATDYEAALKWYRLAAEQGDEDAYLGLADMYERGLGVQADPRVALRWIRRAAEADDPKAQYHLALRYWHGRNVERDNEEASSWFLKSANQNYVAAMVSLGMMHFGDGRPFDPVSGCTWLKLAQRKGTIVKEAERLAETIRKRCDVLRAGQRNEVDERVAHWTPQGVWLERKQREFQELLRKAAEEDARMNVSK
jgi:uncharacterized protein